MTKCSPKSDAELLDAIASELNLLSYRWTDPEKFFVRRNELVQRLRGMAKRLAPVPDATRGPTTTWCPTGGPGVQPPNQPSGGRREPITVIIRREGR